MTQDSQQLISLIRARALHVIQVEMDLFVILIQIDACCVCDLEAVGRRISKDLWKVRLSQSMSVLKPSAQVSASLVRY